MDPVNRGYWNGQYNATNGPEKVELRRVLYDCLAEGERPIHFGELARLALYASGIDKSSTILDIGCGFPKDLGAWLSVGHQGRLIGIDPNSAQFNGLPYTPLSTMPRSVKTAKTAGNPDKLTDFLTYMNYDQNIDYSHIDLYEASAHQLPLADDSVDADQWLFSTYALDRDIQVPAFNEIRRVLKPSGRTLIASSGRENKSGIREYEAKITDFLSSNTDHKFIAPVPVNAWNTSEDVQEQVLEDYRHVYVFRHHKDLVFDSLDRISKWRTSFWTLQDRYIAIEDGQKITPTNEQFEIALMAVLGYKIARSIKQGRPIKDIVRQDMFIASDSELRILPVGFNQVK
ncbi:MAG: class I SAM-dependent methyltransferase [Candidatus Saccharimonadales bacterium]